MSLELNLVGQTIRIRYLTCFDYLRNFLLIPHHILSTNFNLESLTFYFNVNTTFLYCVVYRTVKYCFIICYQISSVITKNMRKNCYSNLFSLCLFV